jgi:hypothetical protein
MSDLEGVGIFPLTSQSLFRGPGPKVGVASAAMDRETTLLSRRVMLFADMHLD